MTQDTLTPLYPGTRAQHSKSMKYLTSTAVYAVATLNRALGTIEGAELYTKAAKRAVWAEMDASTAAQTGAQAMLNLSTIYDNRQGGTTEVGADLRETALRIGTLCQSLGAGADPAPIFEELRDVLSTASGLVLAAMDTRPNRKR